MTFIFGHNFQERQLVLKALTSFYGIGPNIALRIMAQNHINPRAICRQLQQNTILALNTELQGMKIENDLRKELRDNIGRLKDMKTYRGLRHALGLPVRGQNTRSQIRTAMKLNKVERRG